MKIFISWSGELSHKIALEFRDWLPFVIQSIEPYVSSEDIDKGTRWSVDIAKELEDSEFGLICVTPSNVNSPWVNFEAGALSKAFENSKVIPFLFGLKNSDLKKSPLLQFQSTLYNKSEIFKLVQSINSSLDSEKLTDEKLEKTFEVWYERLKEKLDLLLPSINLDKKKPEKNDDLIPKNVVNNEILEEVLTIVRSQQKLLHNPEVLLPKEYLNSIFRRHSKPYPESNHRAWRDLKASYDALIDYIENLDDSEKPDELSKIAENLAIPIRYLLRRMAPNRI